MAHINPNISDIEHAKRRRRWLAIKSDPVAHAKTLEYQRIRRNKIKSNPELLVKHKERMKFLNRRKNQQYKIDTLSYYGGNPPSCKCCDERNISFLTIDHINGGGNKHRKELGRRNLYGWLRINGYPSGFQVLCFNCNHGKFINGGICPHKV